MSEDMEKRVGQYVELRDLLKAIDDAHDKKRQPLVDLMELLSGKMQSFMEENTLENLRTKAGTCYISTRHTASVSDPHAFMKFVIENQEFDLLERRANATAVRDYVKNKGNLPTGCNLNTIQTVGVRRRPGT